MTNVMTATPKDIDTELARLHGELQAARNTRSRHLDHVHYLVKDRRSQDRNRQWRLTGVEAVTKAFAMLADDTVLYYTKKDIALNLTSFQNQLEVIQAIEAEMAPLDAEYRRRRWSRFFLVQNAGGHIHSSMHCSTCFPTTQFAWLPELSGKGEAQAVQDHGAILCTVCFPSAPVEWTNKHEVDKAAKAATLCPNKSLPATMTRYMSYAKCEACGRTVSVTRGYKLRAHKPREGK